MTAITAYISSLIVTLAVFGLILFIGVARGNDLDRTKFYLTATITDETGKVYTKLAYRGSGPWDTKEACEHWVPDDNFKNALPVLLAKAAEAFGPAADVHFSCEQPPALDAPGEHV